jgi:putative ABC transport system ATP-binding protein
MTPETPAVHAVDLTRTYGTGARAVRSVDHVSIGVPHGEVVAVVGPSGSGKSTLLFLLAGLEQPDTGTVRLTGVDWATLEGRARAAFRRRTCGFVAQGSGLLPQATAAENIEVPLLLDGVDPAERERRVGAALARVGLAGHATKLPDQLSGGEQQRVAIARALIAEPAVVLADEPTGSLDSVTAQEVTRLLVGAARDLATAVVLVTHDPAVAAHADRVIELRSGRVAEGAAKRVSP